MRQVPQKLNDNPSSIPLLIGSGRLARHLTFYFDLENVSIKTWKRSQPSAVISLKQELQDAQVILIAISDSQLAPFLQTHHEGLKDKLCIHFSGALSFQNASSFHPLMTFSDELYSQEIYRSIHFVIEEGAPSFSEIFPTLRNAFSYLKNEQRPLYHALCALSGNFSTILWEYTFQRFERELNLSSETLRPYLKQVCANLDKQAAGISQASALTGPLARGETATLEKHLGALAGDPMQNIYEAFIHSYPKLTTQMRKPI